MSIYQRKTLVRQKLSIPKSMTSSNFSKKYVFYLHTSKKSSTFALSLKRVGTNKTKPASLTCVRDRRESTLQRYYIIFIYTNFLTKKRKKSYNKLIQTNAYTHSQLITEMKFGVWKYMFSQKQFQATGQTLLRVFPNKTKSTPQLQINHTYIYNELDNINKLRNRIAHHEPICFGINGQNIDTSYIQSKYWQLQTLFQWMNIDSRALLYGIDHVQQLCDKIRHL